MRGDRAVLKVGVIISIALLLTAGTSFAFDTLARASINKTVIYVARPTNSATEGNWINLTGGFPIKLPILTYSYNLTNASYSINGSPVELNASPQTYTVAYPYNLHSFYLDSSTVTATFYGNSSLGNTVIDVYLINTSPTELKTIADAILDGNITPFENMLNGALNKTSKNTDSAGDAPLTFNTIPAGEYLLLIMLNKTNYTALGVPSDANYTILASTFLSVLDFPSQISAPSSITGSNGAPTNIDITMAISNTTTCSQGYRYGAAAIKKSTYDYTIDLVSTGTRAGTNVTINGVSVIEGFAFFGGGLSSINATELQNKIGSIIGSGNGAVGTGTSTSNSSTISLQIEKTGAYTVLTGVWSYCAGEKLVAFNQTEFVKSAPSTPPGGGGGGGGGGAPPAVVCEDRGVITETEIIDIMITLGHDYGVKFAFSQLMSPLSSVYAARSAVVMSTEIANILLESVRRTDIGLTRIEEGDLYAENADYVLERFPAIDTLIIARGDLNVDSLAATTLSKILNAPILLVEPDRIPEPILEVIKARQPPSLKYKKIYIIGGPEAVSPDVEEELKPLAREIVRLGGATRYETSVMVAKEVLALNGNRIPVITNGRKPVIYALTLADKYRSPIIYLDSPPIRTSSFKKHGRVAGSLSLESFDTFQAIGDKSPIYTMYPDIKTRNIKDAWMYIHTIGFDSAAEKWTVTLNSNPLVYRAHSTPVTSYAGSQLIRFDVGSALKEGVNTLRIEGTSFNVDDQFYVTGVTFVILYDSGEKTEYWILENAAEDGGFGGGGFENVKKATLYSLYLEGYKEADLELNGDLLATNPITPGQVKDVPKFYTLNVIDVTETIKQENSLSGDMPQLAVISVVSDNITPPLIDEESEMDPHQAFVRDYLDQEKFGLSCMVYYEESIHS